MPVDSSSRDKRPAKRPVLGPPAPRITLPALQPQVPKPPYKPKVAAHDLPPTRDARQAPYANIFGPGRSALPAAQQIAVRKAAGSALKPKEQSALTQHLASIPHPAERLAAGKQLAEAAILPTAAIPLLADTAHKALQGALGGADPGHATNIIAGFPRLDIPNEGPVRAELQAAAKKRGVTLPANATLTDLYEAKYGAKPDGLSGLYKNLPRDFALTPVYAAEGGYALGAASQNAIPRAVPVVGGKGDTSGLREIAAQQVDTLRHPLTFAEQHPFQAALAVIGGAKLAGRGAAIAKNLSATPLEATPRSVPLLDETGQPLPPVNGEVPALQRGTLSTRNLTTRGAQKLSDALLARSKGLQSRAVASTLRDARSEARATVQQEANKALKPFLDARSKVSRKEAQRVLENEARGITPEAHAGFRSTVPTPSLGIEHLAETDIPLSPAQEALHAAHVGLDQAQIERAGSLGLLSKFSAQRRAYLPAIKVAADAGDATATRFLDVDHEAQALRKQLDDLNHPHAAVLRDQFDALQASREVALQTFTAKHAAAGGHEPSYVPEQPVKRVESVYGNRGGGSGIAAAKRRYRPGGIYNAKLFEDGTYAPVTEQSIIKNYAVPSRVEQAYRFAQEVSNPERGIVKRVKAGDAIPDGYVLQRVKDASNPLADELHATTGANPPTDPLHSLLSTFDRERSTVPNGPGEYRLWPTSVYHQLEQMRSLNPPTGKGAVVAQQSGRALRNALLYSRPAYPLTNMLGNMAQSAIIAGNIPFGPSYVDALKRSDLPVPPRIEGTGAAAVNFDAIGSGTLRNAWEDRGSTAGGVARVAGFPIAKYTQGLYKASVDIEDWTRRATYLAKAVPEARRLAHPEHGPIQRFAASFKKADAATKKVLQQMADGSTPEAAAAAERAVKVVHQALGDFESMGDHRALGVVVPFWRWSRFVGELMGKTLPLHYPGRALLIYRLGSLGQQGQHQIGSLTPSLQGLIPLGPNAALTTQSVNPFATLGQDVMPSQGQTALDSGKVVGNLSPLIASGYSVVTGKDLESGRTLTNQQGQPITSGEDRLRLLLGEAANVVPATRAFAPLWGGGQTNAPATSVNLPGLVQQGPHHAGEQQPTQSLATNIFNQVSPVKYRAVDLALMAKKGDKLTHSRLLSGYKANRKAAIEKIAGRIAGQRHLDLSDRTNPAVTQVILDAIAEYEKAKR